MFAKKSNEAKQAKIVKLNQTSDYKPNIQQSSIPMSKPQLTRYDSFETSSAASSYSSSEIDEQENDVTGECLTKLCVIRDYKGGALIYGDIGVKRGQLIYLICESEFYYFIENNQGKQGFVPKEICVNLDKMRRIQTKPFCKITSL